LTDSQRRLAEVLEQVTSGPKKSLGQNFLVSDVVIGRIIDAAKNYEFDHLIEVGPGPGSITHFLKDLTPQFTAIELDREWAEYWRNQGVPIIEGDALQLNWQDLIKPKTLLVSNLPYQISSSIVIDRCLDPVPLLGMVLMFQKEVAQKIRGEVGSDNYGFLTVMAQSFWKIHFVSEAGPRDFFPPPKVASRVLRFVRVTEADCPSDPQGYLQFVKQAFSQRRKTLRSNWEGYLNQKRSGMWPEVLNTVMSWGFSEKLRAEELSPGQFMDLYKNCYIGK
jgi:16S rRNA (adenine1518-N6/adenine1519-N6)-dimethyltransferase